jgi:hypothetical protein
VLELYAAKEVRGSIEIPPSVDMFILGSAVALSTERQVTISPRIDTPAAAGWIRSLEGHLEVREDAGAFVCRRADAAPDAPVVLETGSIPCRDFIVFLLLGLGKKIIAAGASRKGIDGWKERAAAMGCALGTAGVENGAEIFLETDGAFHVPDRCFGADEAHAVLGLAMGLRRHAVFQVDQVFVSAARDVITAFGYGLAVKSCAPRREKDPLMKRLHFLKTKRKTEAAMIPFNVSVDFSPEPGTDVCITLPGDDLYAAMILAAKSLVQKGGLVISGAPLASWATQTMDFIRKMGCTVGVQPTGETSFGPVGNVQLQRFQLGGRKVECRPLFQYRSQLPVMVMLSAFAAEQSVFRGLEDLRLDQPDPIETILACIRTLGARHGEMPDGIVVEGAKQYDGFDLSEPFPAAIAGAFTIAGLKCMGGSTVNDRDLLQRWPDFKERLFAVCDFKQ